MPLKLVERSLIKDIVGINRADTLQDRAIDLLVDQVSREVEYVCRREFTLATRTEYHPSYDQMPTDPTSQFIQLKCPPVNAPATLVLMWSPDERWDENGVTLGSADYTLDSVKGLVSVHRSAELLEELALASLVLRIFAYAPRGFRVSYSGGYATASQPSPWVSDPTDDFDVVQVPQGLKYLVARRIAEELTEKKFVGFSESALAALVAYRV